jgi:pseudaminic acid biosynthesis-associated methylase
LKRGSAALQTNQIEFWKGDFGQQYTDRNTYGVEGLDHFYLNQFGLSRTDMNKQFIGDLTINRTLEVGCNVGNVLLNLQSIGMDELYGIELQQYAVEKAKELTKGINIIQGSAFDIPFKDGFFDLVFTSGVLIHISPEDIELAIDEIYRVSNRYIWGFEYYSEEYTEIDYRGNAGKLWKAKFSDIFRSKYPNLKLLKEKNFPYLNNSHNSDQMYLLEKC